MRLPPGSISQIIQVRKDSIYPRKYLDLQVRTVDLSAPRVERGIIKGYVTRNDRTYAHPTRRPYFARAVRHLANAVMAASLVAGLAGIGAEALCLTIFFLVWMARIAGSVVSRWLEMEPDTVIYFAPWVRESCRQRYSFRSDARYAKKKRRVINTNTIRTVFVFSFGVVHKAAPPGNMLRFTANRMRNSI